MVGGSGNQFDMCCVCVFGASRSISRLGRHGRCRRLMNAKTAFISSKQLYLRESFYSTSIDVCELSGAKESDYEQEPSSCSSKVTM